jgi:flavin reductase (DIM6/NTAB) family NADH-FMN oxidoreductase RutF
MKVKIAAKNSLYPLPTVLVGALVAGKPNYVAIAHVGIMAPDTVSLGMNKAHYTNQGIKTNKTFSINIPSVKQIRETEYCGLVSGKKVDKAALVKPVYGKLEPAPLIEECPVNMECELVQTVDFPEHDVFVGKVAATYCEESIVAKSSVDIEKLQPILFAMNDRSYYSLGKRLAKAWDVGKDLNK